MARSLVLFALCLGLVAVLGSQPCAALSLQHQHSKQEGSDHHDGGSAPLLPQEVLDMIELGSTSEDTKTEVHRALMRLLQFHRSRLAAAEGQGLLADLTCDGCRVAWDAIWAGIKNGGVDEKIVDDAANVTCHLLIKDAFAADLCTDAWDALMHWAHSIRRVISYNLTVLACADLFQVCKVDCCVSKHLPEQVHISYTGGDALKAGEMRATWVSATKTTGPVVQWWPTAAGRNANASKTAGGESRTYTVAGWVGWIHGAVMTGLQPDTEYTYTVGSDDAGFSPEFSFRTLPLNVGTSERPLRVATFADMGVGGDHKQTITQLESLVANGELDLIVHTGDISYSDGDSYRWDRFMRQMEPIVSRIPYMTTPGNHELLWNFTAYKQRFFTPATGYGGPDDAMYYTFSVGRFRFLLLDSETWYDTPRMDPVQVAWADRVLTEANQMKQFIFVGFHRPLYCSPHGHVKKDCGAYSAYLRERIEPVLHAHNVAMVQTGHVHNYERTWSVYNSTVQSHSYNNTNGYVSFVNGAAGCTEGLSSFGDCPTPDWSAKRMATTGFLLLNMTADATTGTGGSASVQFVSSKDMSILDSIVVTKDTTN